MLGKDLETEFFKNQEIESAKAELTQMEAMLILAGNPTLGASIDIAGLSIGVSLNERLMPIIEAEMAEIKKFLAGEPNNYE